MNWDLGVNLGNLSILVRACWIVTFETLSKKRDFGLEGIVNFVSAVIKLGYGLL